VAELKAIKAEYKAETGKDYDKEMKAKQKEADKAAKAAKKNAAPAAAAPAPGAGGEFAEKANHPAFKAVAAQGDKIRGMKVPSLFPASSILPPFLSTFLSSSKRSFLSSSKHYFLPSFRPLLPSVLYFRPLLPPVLYFRPPVLPSSLRPFLPSSPTSFL
jgi:hypothetical protein